MNIAKKNQVSRQTSSDPATELPSISSQSSHLNIRFDEVEMLTNAGMWMLDLHNMLFHASERTNKLLGTNAPHNTIEYYLQNVHPEDRKRIHASYQASTLPKQNYVSETFRVHISGQETILKSRIKLDLDNEGKISRLFGTLEDVTNVQKTERLQNELISIVSHELRTPLTSIKGSIGLLLGGIGGSLPAQATKLLKLASNNTERLLALVNDLLDLEKIEAGKIAFDIKAVHLNELIEKAIEENEGFGQQFNVSFNLESTKKTYIWADPARLIQVINNLLSNAAKFSPTQGHVDIKIETTENIATVMILDRGPGVPKSFRQKIFEKFTQVEKSSTRKREGTGLGLSISRALIEKQSGTLEYAPREGGGSCFHFSLPLAPLPVQEKTLVVQDRRVLIIEDNEDVSHLLQHQLKRAKMKVDLATTADEAKDILRGNDTPYDIILLDIHLAGEDGITLFKEMRDEGRLRRTPVLILSASADVVKNQYKNTNEDLTGIAEWLQKPIGGKLLRLKVQETIERNNLPKVLHIEKNLDNQQTVAISLQKEANVVFSSNPVQARKMIEHYDFDFVLLNYDKRDTNSRQLLGELRSLLPTSQVILLSEHNLDEPTTQQADAVLSMSDLKNDNLMDYIRTALI
ncbi:MAG TPA: hypothetical protein DCE42_03880 [Myxococcales bacterium]|nr:hypothetical protein [Deltaproteobacteria bacterium]MBU48542.1 hypothetical protein [Deltaproteobacteria bacterium]HAA53865.1 hypothetical protein [Myxococcales bacterium]|tara:strand:- start:16464 stop:18362 length:1899 start_codon:yes stop_codon:yes gene_type:complete